VIAQSRDAGGHGTVAIGVGTARPAISGRAASPNACPQGQSVGNGQSRVGHPTEVTGGGGQSHVYGGAGQFVVIGGQLAVTI
jgi:hypothetical protein